MVGRTVQKRIFVLVPVFIASKWAGTVVSRGLFFFLPIHILIIKMSFSRHFHEVLVCIQYNTTHNSKMN